MRVMIFGATGIVGQGVLRECLLDPSVSEVRSIGRTPLERTHPRLSQTIKSDMFQFGPEDDAALSGFDTCFFCLTDLVYIYKIGKLIYGCQLGKEKRRTKIRRFS